MRKALLMLSFFILSPVFSDIFIVRENTPEQAKLSAAIVSRFKEVLPKTVLLEINILPDGTLDRKPAADSPFIIVLSKKALDIINGFFPGTPVIAAGLESASGTSSEGANVSFVFSLPGASSFLSLARKFKGDLSLIGTIYLSDEYDAYTEYLGKEFAWAGIEFIPVKLHSKSEIFTALNELLKRKPDLVFIIPDFSLFDVNSLRLVHLNAVKAFTMTAGTSRAFTQGGILFSVDIGYEQIADQTVRLAADVMRKWKKQIVYLECLKYFINTNTASKIGIEIPENVLEGAVERISVVN